MRTVPTNNPHRIVQAVAWLYIAPRLVVASLLVGIFGLAALMVLAGLARGWLLRLGA